jgi:YHS domain-containing protein
MKNKLNLLVWVLILAILGTLWAASKQSPAQSVAATNVPAPAVNAPATDKVPDKPYPFATSVVSGETLGSASTVVTFEQDGYEVKLASAAEADTFKKNPAPYLAKIEEAYKNAKPCPLTVCPVMGDALDKDAYVFVYEGRQFKLCCDSCLADFQKDPGKFVKIWDDAATAQADKK